MAFSSILRSVSNATSGFGNLMINKKASPKDRMFEKSSLGVENMIQDMYNFGKEATNCLATVITYILVITNSLCYQILQMHRQQWQTTIRMQIMGGCWQHHIP